MLHVELLYENLRTNNFSQLQYNLLGLEIERNLPGGVKSSMAYDHAGQPHTHKVTGSGGKLRMNKRYRWNPNDRLDQIINEISGGTTLFSHDAFGNLASCQYADGNYDYKLPDSTGNLYRDKNQKGRKYGAGGQLLQTENNCYEYDAEGNLVRKTGNGENKIYEWTGNGMLKLVRHEDGSETKFEYDALGRRTAKIHRGKITRFIWDGNVPLHEWEYQEKERPLLVYNEEPDEWEYNHEEFFDKDTVTTWIFDEGTFRPSGKLIGDKKYSIICDYLGTPTQAYDETGQLVWECELDIYGKIRNIVGESSLIPFRYQGQYEDSETGLYYNRFRYYDAEAGVYVSQDPIGLDSGELNIYSYVDDVNAWIDVFGLTGIIYLRTDPVTGAEYIGKSKSPEAFKRRQYSHNRKLRKSSGDLTAEYKFKKLETNVTGKENLSYREETNIRKKGGIAKDGGPLENKIHAMNDKEYKKMGDDMDNLGKKIKKGCK